MDANTREWNYEVAPLTFIALGSNLGDAAQNIRRAMDRLQSLSSTPIQRSSLWRSPPVACPPGSPDFVNAVVGLVPISGETPKTLLAKLQAIEREFGRRPKHVVNEPRPLDLDLIAFGSAIVQDKRLTLPHPRAVQRRFVLAPWAEIAPEFCLPNSTQTVAELLAALGDDQKIERIE